VDSFEAVGRDTFVTLLCNGLTPSHKVLDFGCGSLRNGYWLVRFLDADCYFGIEPREERIKAGLECCLDQHIVEDKRPRFAFNEDVDLGVFGQVFDCVLARSILTHTFPGALDRLLEQFRRHSAPKGFFLASYWPADGEHRYKGNGLVGDVLPAEEMQISHGAVKYTFAYMQAAASRAGLEVREIMYSQPLNGQLWLRFGVRETPRLTLPAPTMSYESP
jgi:SAM-dependent methyltransferase